MMFSHNELKLKLEKKLPQQYLIFENLNNTIARIQKT